MYVVDRLKQIIIRGGENIGCSEVESALAGYPSIIEACVYGVPDERLGEEVAATIYADNQVDVAALQESLKSKLANFKIPKYVRISETPLARIASGKSTRNRSRKSMFSNWIPKRLRTIPELSTRKRKSGTILYCT
ncbi:MAG: hypothetical protein IPF97_17725 [Sphingomonadales bacterium]|nr:hypothetical protein [Sphingomonadales bacterium]